MTRRTIALVQLVLAGVFLVGAVVSWTSASSVEPAAPVAPGEPWMTTTIYYPGLVMLALASTTVAGVLVVFGVARLRRR